VAAGAARFPGWDMLRFFGSPDTASILPASVHSFVQELTSSFDLKSLNTGKKARPPWQLVRHGSPAGTCYAESGSA
jgi:hypothetical protein